MGNQHYTTATRTEVFEWLMEGVFRLAGETVFHGDKELAQRFNARRRSEHGDPRVDLYHKNKRKSINVSHLVWMWNTESIIPEDWEIHHLDGNPHNNRFENLLCLHPSDHLKFHTDEASPDEDDEIPF